MKNILIISIILLGSFQSKSQNWVQLQTPSPRNLYGCWFDPVFPDTGMAVGWYFQSNDRLPFSFNTVNGGNTFSTASLFQVYFYAASDVWFTNSYNGIVVGDGIIQTTNGGNTWNIVVDATMTQAGILGNVMFSNSTDGYAVGQRYDFSYTFFEGMIYKTGNAGGSWMDYTISSEANGENTLMNTVYAVGNGIVYAGAENTLGGNTLFKSVDDGITWTSLSFSQSIRSLYFFSADTGFAATTAGLFKTEDGGLTWSHILPTTSALNTIQIKNGFGFTAGENGVIYTTSDSGSSWNQMASPVTTSISDISVISPYLAYAVGTSGTFLKYTNSVGVKENLSSEGEAWIDAGHLLNIRWNPEHSSPNSITLVNVEGKIVKDLVVGNLNSGISGCVADLSTVPSGIYFLRIISADKISTRKIAWVK